MYKKELTIAAAMLYACEGTKARKDPRSKDRFIYSIELTNSDPRIISLFSIFLEKVLEIDWSRIRGQLFIYPDLVENDLISYWSKISKIPASQF